MKYASKITASLLAALVMTGTAVTIPAADNCFGTSVSAYGTYSYSDKVSYKLFSDCVQVTWTPVTPCSYYFIQICNTNGEVLSTSRVWNTINTAVFYYSNMTLDTDSAGNTVDTTFAVSVVGIYGEGVDETSLPTVILSSFTVKPDMSGYALYGTPENLTASCTDSTVTLSWTNSSLTDDIFRVKVTDSSGKTVYNAETDKLTATVKKLSSGKTYTASIKNNAYSAYAEISFTLNEAAADTSTAGGTSTDKAEATTAGSFSKTKLSAPKNVKAKAGTSKVTLSWSKVSGADAYRVYMYDEAKGKYVRCKTVKGNKCTIKSLTSGESYKFRVAAVTYDASTKKYTAGKASKSVTAECK